MKFLQDEEAATEEGGEAPAVTEEATTMEVETTTAGANMIMYQPWLIAATVAAFATRAMWVKFRQIRLAARNQKQEKQEMKRLSEMQDDKQNDSETEAESEGECEAEDEGAPAVKQDELLQHLQTDAGPNCRPIES